MATATSSSVNNILLLMELASFVTASGSIQSDGGSVPERWRFLFHCAESLPAALLAINEEHA
ncbi:hypothetical protein AwEntero_10820 [Enterobacterales bacterium]|nr:hypothetical protein AwEntero_10820 [Enterobacterales bacterium]